MLLSKMKRYIGNKFIFNYKGKKVNVIIIILLSILISELVMYGLYMIQNDGYISFVDAVKNMSKWDSGWYRTIILQGYDEFPSGHPNGDAANWAFFPLYPIIVKIFYLVINVDPYIIGSFISTICIIGSLIMGYLYILETRDNKSKGIIFIILMSLGMFSFYFYITYTESLYLLLLISALYFLYKEKYILVGILGAFASATRSMGVMLVFAIAVQYTAKYLEKDERTFKGYICEALKNAKLILGVLLIPSGIFTYMNYLGHKVGDPMAFSRIEIAWGKHISNPFRNLYNAFTNGNKYDMVMAIFAVLAIGIIFYLIINKRFVEGILGIIFVFIPLSTGMQSMSRYLIGSFVYILGLIDIISTIKNKIIIKIIIGISIGIEIILIIGWIKGSAYLC